MVIDNPDHGSRGRKSDENAMEKRQTSAATASQSSAAMERHTQREIWMTNLKMLVVAFIAALTLGGCAGMMNTAPTTGDSTFPEGSVQVAPD